MTSVGMRKVSWALGLFTAVAILACWVGFVTCEVGLACESPALASEAFGVETFENPILQQNGMPATQAGSHPFSMSTTFFLKHHRGEGIPEEFFIFPNGGDPKDVVVNLPAGVIVNPIATETRCTEAELENVAGCPNASAVGVVNISFIIPESTEGTTAVFNMVPPPGVPAEFGLNAGGIDIVAHVLGGVRTGGDYGLSGSVFAITSFKEVYGVKLTLWGSPSDPSHDKERGFCSGTFGKGKVEEEEAELKKEEEEGKVKNKTRFCAVERTSKPFLTMPGSCTGAPLTTTMGVNSWQEPGNFVQASASSPAVTGCENLSFTPKLSAQPDTTTADSPSGLSVDLKIPQQESLSSLAEADLKDAVVTLPVGMAVSPSAANGLQACPLLKGKANEGKEEKKEISGINLESKQPANCPDGSKLGTVEIETPLLEHPLKGAVYLAQQGNNPFGSLIALYLVAEGQGVVVKLAGEVALDPTTGQITTSFRNNPQLPFSDLRLNFFGGSGGSLITPPACGPYSTTSSLTPWSGAPAATPSDTFSINAGCTAGFAPSFVAGMTSTQAGAFSPFSVTFSRHDGEQRFGGTTVTTPPGLLGVLKSVAQCPEPQASTGACGSQSLIGHTTVGAGPGSDPFFVGGNVFLTGPYKGAPFGLSIVTHAVAGPFDLGNVIVRAAINVDPHTSQITVTSDPLPTILQGIPLDLKTVNVTVDRQGFLFNPTNCSQLAVNATITSTSGASAGVSSPFGATNCANLPFHPSFVVSTQAKTSKAKGASLDVKVASSTGQANIGKVRTVLPKQLPARLTTLQKACVDSVFNTNPAACPIASSVGTATAVTPLLAHPLTGPAYLVSHGGAAFPDLVIVLQGEGITLYLDGNTNIKKGITTSTFNSIPDAPVSSFELKLPEGQFSALTTDIPTKAKGNLCKQKLTMPTTITGQNGAVVKQATKITVTGCPRTKHAHKAKTSRKHHKSTRTRRKA
jgi:hypothetical protein